MSDSNGSYETLKRMMCSPSWYSLFSFLFLYDFYFFFHFKSFEDTITQSPYIKLMPILQNFYIFLPLTPEMLQYAIFFLFHLFPPLFENESLGHFDGIFCITENYTLFFVHFALIHVDLIFDHRLRNNWKK